MQGTVSGEYHVYNTLLDMIVVFDPVKRRLHMLKQSFQKDIPLLDVDAYNLFKIVDDLPGASMISTSLLRLSDWNL